MFHPKLTPLPLLSQIYGESFNISGLGGYVNCGKTGLKAGMAHSPTLPDRDQSGKIREKCESLERIWLVMVCKTHIDFSSKCAELGPQHCRLQK
jgi:hypothetical protein